MRTVATALCGFLAVVSGPAACQSDALERARALMRESPLIDGHNDLPWQIRVRGQLRFATLDIGEPQPSLMTDIPRLRRGLVGGQFWSVYAGAEFAPGGAARAGMEQVDVVHRMIARYPETLGLATTADDVLQLHRRGKIASLLGLEGGHMIENSLGLLRAYYRAGVRYMTLTHSDNTDWADAATDTLRHGGLTPFGEEVVREMNRLGMLVDLSHASDSTMWDVLGVSEAPVIFSHSSSRYFVPHARNIPDDVARAVADNGGVIMVTFVPEFIDPVSYAHGRRRDSVLAVLRQTGVSGGSLDEARRAWQAENPMPRPGLGVVVDHLDHLRAIAGADHIGLGSDLDGITATPVGLEDVSRFPELVAELVRRGWSDGDIKRVMGLNVLRVLRAAEQVAVRIQGERGPSTAQIEMLDAWPTTPPWQRPARN